MQPTLQRVATRNEPRTGTVTYVLEHDGARRAGVLLDQPLAWDDPLLSPSA